LGHNPSRRRRRGRRSALTLSTQVRTTLAGSTEVRPRLPWCALHRRALAGWLAGCSRARGSGRGWRNWRCRTRHCWRLCGRCTLHRPGRSGARSGIRSGIRNKGTRWNTWLGCLRLSGLRSGWTLGYGRSFVLTLLNGLEHVAGLRNPRPVNLLFWLIVCSLRSPGTVPAAGTLEVLAHTLGFVFFERA
jgi:hypothetical protein